MPEFQAFSKELVCGVQTRGPQGEEKGVCARVGCEELGGLTGRGRLQCPGRRGPQKEPREHRQQLWHELEARKLQPSQESPAPEQWRAGQEVVGAGGTAQKQSPQKGGGLEVLIKGNRGVEGDPAFQ